MGETLLAPLDDVASGRYPPPDGSVTVLPQPGPRPQTRHRRPAPRPGRRAAVGADRPGQRGECAGLPLGRLHPVAAEALLVAP
jgi:hypothetical protein